MPNHAEDNNKHKTIVHCRLCHWYATRDELLLVFMVEPHLVGINTVVLAVSLAVMLSSRRLLYTVTRYRAHYVKTRRHPQNRKYTTYRYTARGGPSYGHSQYVE